MYTTFCFHIIKDYIVVEWLEKLLYIKRKYSTLKCDMFGYYLYQIALKVSKN